ncbi:putative ATP-dependent RNA helicase Dbp73D [Anticarsia gemmatalis]|uniref:putative ATP-dependent RNA helicase Dbp73D n=1 Tax=Anticarsia gemmatalis TaxID=129554 RepID=UPI003F75CC64
MSSNMDLFVINRYKDDNEGIDIAEQEAKHLENLKKRIAERKSAFVTKKPAAVITLKPQKVEESHIPEKVQKVDIKQVKDDKTTQSEQETVTETTESKKQKQESKKPKLSNEYKVLGVSDFEKKIKVSRVLPYWLSHPINISTKLKTSSCPVEEQDWLHSSLKAILLSEGVTNLFPVQEKVIPFVLDEHKSTYPFWPHDICVSAPTGSGKTLSFVLPIIQILMNEIGCHIRALVVLPVQELAAQVAKVFKKYSAKTRLKVALLGGSTPLQQEQQNLMRYTESSGWVSEVDIIVCTAGRLVEHLQNTEGFSLKHLKFLVIDEADRIMDHIQNDWLYHVDRHIKLENELMTGRHSNLTWSSLVEQRPPPHKLLFSATLSQDPEKLEQWGLFQPKLFSSAAITNYDDEDQIRLYATPEELVEQSVTCEAEHKPLVLYHFLVDQKWDKVLCFTNAAESAHRLSVLLNTWGTGKFKVAELSSALDKSTRESVLKKFTSSEINVLIGTDALARGIDIPDCNYVVSYDPPRNIKTYIHRVGRTGRAGRIGHAVTILLPNQVSLFKELIQSGGKAQLPQIQIETSILENLSDGYHQAISATKQQIHAEIDSKVKKSIEIKRRLKSKPQKRKLGNV